MKRLPFVLGVTALGGLLAAAGGQSAKASFHQRLEDFLQRARAERQRLGLGDMRAAKKKYPTPEISLISTGGSQGGGGDSGAEVVCLKPGQTRELTFEARMPAGSMVAFDCDALEVLEEKVSEDKARVKVRVKKDALPGSCDFVAVAAVSGVQNRVPAVNIGGRYVWDLKLTNGWTSRWEMSDEKCTGEPTLQSTWNAKGKKLGTRPVSLSGEGATWQAEIQATPEEQEQAMNQAQDVFSSPEYTQTMEKLTELTDKMSEECPSKKDMNACFQRYQKQMEKLQAKMDALNDGMGGGSEVRQVGCAKLDLKVAKGGAVKGTGTGCGAPGETGVQGRVAFTPTR